MKLLIVSHWLPARIDNGSRIRAFNLIKCLSKRHAITLFTFGRVDGAVDLTSLQSMCQHVEIVEPVRRNARLPFHGLLSRVPRSQLALDNTIMHDLVRSAIARHDVAIALQVGAARYLEGYTECPRIFEEVEVGLVRERWLSSGSVARRLRDGLTWLKFRRFVRDLVEDFDWATVVSERERQHLQDIGCDPGRISVIPNGAETGPLGRRVHRVPRLIYPGSVTYSANLDAVVHFSRNILPEVRRRCPEVVFMVTGSTDGVESDALPFGEGVIFTGWLPEVESMIADSAVCVVPLRVGGGTRLKVLQAMALGTPVVSTSKGIEGLELESGIHLLVADNSSAFAAHVVELLHNPELGERLAGAAHRLVSERYSWQTSGATLDQVLVDAVRQHRVAARN